jgi:hypothetical protein
VSLKELREIQINFLPIGNIGNILFFTKKYRPQFDFELPHR